jgi:hypothetical protein
MKKILQILLILLVNKSVLAEDSIPKSTELRSNEVQIAINGGSSINYGLYYTLGYTRLFKLKSNSFLGFYFGLGYLPKKAGFLNEIGFEGYKFYSYTGRFEFKRKIKNFAIHTALEYTYLAEKKGTVDEDEHQYMGKIGMDMYLFKRHLSFTPQIGLGRVLFKYPMAQSYSSDFYFNIGFDIGFCF